MNVHTPTKHDLQVYRKWLDALVTRLTGGVAELAAEVSRPAGMEAAVADEAAHTPTAVSTEADEEVARSVLMSEEQLLAEARAALARIDAGTFGHCQRCNHVIAKTRLDALPYARHCIKCARVVEGIKG